MNFAALMLALFLKHKRVSIDALSEEAGIDYDAAIYFMTKSKWRPLEQLNEKRLETICAHRGTAPNKKKGVNAIDDTGCPKPYAKKTESVKFQYCGPLKRKAKCLVAVAAAYCDGKKQFPIYLEPYRPANEFELGEEDHEFKSKIKIAMEFIVKLHNDDRFPTTDVVDSWYTASKIIDLEERLGRTIIGEIKSDRTFLFKEAGAKQGNYINRDELVKLVKEKYSHKLKCMIRKNKNGTKRKLWYYSFITNLNESKTKIKAVLIIGQLYEDDEKEARILICNKLSMTPKQIIKTYDLRWGIEVCFRQLKDTFCFDQFQMRKLKNIERYWFLVLTAWTATYCCKQMGILSKIIEVEGGTISAYAKTIRKLVKFESGRKLSKNGEDVEHYGIISKRAEKRVA